jgi:D-alanine transaminase
MHDIVYINGEFKNKKEASVSVTDRGFLFGDSVYDSTAVLDGKLVDFEHHFKNIAKAMTKLHYKTKINKKHFLQFHRQLIKKNKIKNGLVYCQVSRGVQESRDFNFQTANESTIFAFGYSHSKTDQKEVKQGIKVCVKEDLRWKKTALKTNQLLYQTLIKSESVVMGYDDAWMCDSKGITEATSSNAWIVKGKKLISRNANGRIYNGTTKQNLAKVAMSMGLKVEFRPFSLEEALECDEAFQTSIKQLLTPVVSINAIVIKDGKPGKLTTKLRREYKNYLVKHLRDR